MKRRLMSFLVAICVLLLIAVVALSIRSYWTADWLIHVQPGRQTSARSVHGRLLLDTMGDAHVPLWPGRRRWMRGTESAGKTDELIDHPAVRARRFLGFAYADVGSVGMPTRRITALAIPYWSIALLLLIPPTLALRRARRRRWLKRHRHCPACGYDLRATPSRCPECGTAVESASAPSLRYAGENL